MGPPIAVQIVDEFGYNQLPARESPFRRGAFMSLPFAELTRRRLLQAGAAGALGMLPRNSLAIPATKPIRSCILIFYYGGPSHIDTIDPKPNAPAEVRGEYRTVPTAVPGIRVCEHLPRTAKLMDRLAVIRSLHHPMRNHNSAAAEVFTGRTPEGGDQELLSDDPRGMPNLGSAVAFALGARANVLPYVALPYTLYNVVQLPGQTPGLLGGAFDRFQVERDPSAADFRVDALDSQNDLRDRAALLNRLDRDRLPGSAKRAGAYRDRALKLATSPEIARLFDISKEPDRVRDHYGRHRLGQSMLLARRLVEGGVNFVSVYDGQRNGQEANWDSHEKLFPRHGQLIPPTDQAFSALIEDLESRGLLDSTLVIGAAEFGRTPKINKSAGRDHWPDCYSVVLAGGGVTGGAIFGASDRIGAYPALDPVTPADLAATIFWRFGIDPETEVKDQTGRPFKLANGEPIAKLF
jgi:hypothetical protein